MTMSKLELMQYTANGTMDSYYSTFDEIQSDFNLAQSLFYASHFQAIRYPTTEDAALVCLCLPRVNMIQTL